MLREGDDPMPLVFDNLPLPRVQEASIDSDPGPDAD